VREVVAGMVIDCIAEAESAETIASFGKGRASLPMVIAPDDVAILVKHVSI
jgi:hypothetical protein